MTKRLFYIVSFHRFVEKLQFKCENTNTKLYVVTKEYTSKTCIFCDVVNNVGSFEIYKCKECNSVIDRDVNANRNILYKISGFGSNKDLLPELQMCFTTVKILYRIILPLS